MSKRPIRPVERQRMRPWLENLLNKKVVEGFKWRNKEENIFEIPWRHGSRHGYNVNKDADLFERWAKHTGRYEDKNPNPKKWKANFRCALNSLEDCKEIVNKTNQNKTVRVFQFVEVKSKKEGRRPYKRRKLPSLDYDESDSSSKYSESSFLSKDTLDSVESPRVINSFKDHIDKCESDKAIFGADSSTTTLSCPTESKKTDAKEIMDLLSQFAKPDSTSDCNPFKKEKTICKEEPMEVIEIVYPFKSDSLESCEIHRGVLPKHMSGFVMMIHSNCDTRVKTDENDVSSPIKTFYLDDFTTSEIGETEIRDSDSNG